MKKHPLFNFFLITFLITWGIAGLFFLFPAQVVKLTMKTADAYHPLFCLAASAPTISAFIVILWMRGRKGLVQFWALFGACSDALVHRSLCGDRWVWRWAALSRTGMGLTVPTPPFSIYTFIPFAIYWVLHLQHHPRQYSVDDCHALGGQSALFACNREWLFICRVHDPVFGYGVFA